jgi:hypothetical protein
MRVHPKALGLVLLAMLVMSAVVASTAHGTAKFTTANGVYPAVGTGTQEGTASENYFETTSEYRVHCPNANIKYETTFTAATTIITVTPHFSNCVKTTFGSGGSASNIDLNGCHFEFEALGYEAESNSTTGRAKIVCPTGTSILITTGTCQVHVLPQTVGGAAGEITYTNIAGGEVTPHDYITVDVNIVNKIHYIDTDGFLCPFSGDTTATNGDFKTTVIVKGYGDSGNANHSTTASGNHPKQEYLHPATETDIHVK